MGTRLWIFVGERRTSDGKGKRRSRFPEGMTERKATTTAIRAATATREEADPTGNDRKNSKGAL
jgi:hypothetical protein